MTTAFLFTAVALAAPQAAAPSIPTSRVAQISQCLVSLVADVQVPALEAGALTSVAAAEGDYVKQGQLLAQIDDRQPIVDKLAAQLQRDAALAKAQDDIEVRYAQAAFA